MLNNEKLVIQALPQINTNDVLPLSFKITDAGLHTVSISKMENVPSDLNIYLFDNTTGTYYNLKNQNAQLLFSWGKKNNKFSILFKNENTLDDTAVEVEKIYTSYNGSSKNLELHTNEPLANLESLKIYNAIGQEVLTVNAPKSHVINLSQLTDGVYFLKVNTKNIKSIKTIKFVKY